MPKNKLSDVIKELAFQMEEKEKQAVKLIIANNEIVFQNEEKEKRASELIITNKELVFQKEEKEKLLEELFIAKKELAFLNNEKEKREVELGIANKELAFQDDEKGKRAEELTIANKELVFQDEEKEKRAVELGIANKEKGKRAAELGLANKELAFQDEEKGKRAEELIVANKELVFQNEEKEKRAAELSIANKELAFQNNEKEKRAAELNIANIELSFQNDEKEKRAEELTIANKELAFQNDEKEKRAVEKEKRAVELGIANKELAFQNKEKEKRAAELNMANIELAFQNKEKEKRAAELIIANKELAFQNDEKEKRAAELIIANKELAFQNNEKEKRAAELIIANIELAFQNDEKEKRAEELTIANKELAFQNDEKEKRAAEKEKRALELGIANKELAFENKEKEKRAAELSIANIELAFQNDEKEKRAAELSIANIELAFQNDEKEKRAAELIIANYARSLIEASLDPLVTISATGKILDVNEASIKVTGIAREKLIDTDFSNYFTEPKKAQEGYQQVFEKGFVADYPLTIKHKNGNLTDVLYNASVYKDDKGNVLGVFAAARDVTEQKQASQYARSLIEASLDPLVTISADGKITDVNEASIKVTGNSREKLVGTDFSNYFTEPKKAQEGYQQVFKKGFVADYPLTIKHKNGNLTDVLYNASVYKDDKGNVLGVFAAARDVTEQKWAIDLRIANKELVVQNEEKEKRAEELVILVKELESFNYISSHDLQEPLRQIQIFSSRISDGEIKHLSDAGKTYFEKINNAAKRMQNLINDLLAYSRTKTEARKFINISLNQIINEVKADFEEIISDKHATIEVADLGVANVITFQFRQLMYNLIGNALKFSKPDTPPHIIIKNEKVKSNQVPDVDQITETEYYHISITDNGIGFEQQYKDRIFEVFQRLHDKQKIAGTGIGLAIVKNIVENHNGIITATGELNKGATFDIYIPTIQKL